MLLHNTAILILKMSKKSREIGAILDISDPNQWKSDSDCHMTRLANHFRHSVAI